MNIAVVTVYEFERKRKEGASYDSLSQHLASGEEHLRSARSSEVNERMLSLVLNNLAHYQLIRAEWYREAAKGEPKAALSAGRDFIRRAMNLPQRSEVVFLTAAEIECELLAEEPDLVNQWSMESKREKLQEVLGLVRTSIDQGYKGYYGLDRTEFFKKKRFFQRLSILGQPGWETQVLIAAGVPLN